MNDVPGTSPERLIIWSPERPAAGCRGRPLDFPIYNFCKFIFPVKTSNRCVKQELLHLKDTFFIKFFCWPPKSPLKISWRSQTLGLLGDLQGTSLGRRVLAWKLFNFIIIFSLWSSCNFCGYWTSTSRKYPSSLF